MSRSRSLKSARQRLHKQAVKYKQVKDALADERNQMADYCGGVTSFGQRTLGVLVENYRNDAPPVRCKQLINLMMEAAVERGLVEWHEPTKGWRLR